MPRASGNKVDRDGIGFHEGRKCMCSAVGVDGINWLWSLGHSVTEKDSAALVELLIGDSNKQASDNDRATDTLRDSIAHNTVSYAGVLKHLQDESVVPT